MNDLQTIEVQNEQASLRDACENVRPFRPEPRFVDSLLSGLPTRLPRVGRWINPAGYFRCGKYPPLVCSVTDEDSAEPRDWPFGFVPYPPRDAIQWIKRVVAVDPHAHFAVVFTYAVAGISCAIEIGVFYKDKRGCEQ